MQGGRRIAKAVLACVLALMLPHTAGAHGENASGAVLVAAAIGGDIEAVRADGAGMRRLTFGGNTSEPRLGPGGRRIAYLSASRRRKDDRRIPIVDSVWVVPVDGRPDGTSARRLAWIRKPTFNERLAWSPDGRFLAWDDGASVMMRAVNGGPARAAITTHPVGSYAPGDTIAWSPDSHRVAVVAPLFAGSNQGNPQALHVIIEGVAGGAPLAVLVRFPPAMLGPGTNPPGSYASPLGLAWMPDGRHFLITTMQRGEGGSLSGIWSVSDRGGMARLLFGSRATLLGKVDFHSSVSGSTHYLLSPDWRSLALDPYTHFWIARIDGSHVRRLWPNVGRGCVLQQYTWLRDSSGLAYVTLCGIPHVPSTRYRWRLFSVRFNRPAPRLLAQVFAPTVSSTPPLDVAPGYRCLACGG